MPRYDETMNHFGNVTTVNGSNNLAETFNYGNNAFNSYDHDPRHFSGEDPDQTGHSDRSRARTNEEYPHRTTNHFGNITEVDGYSNVAPTFNHGSNAYNSYDTRGPRHYPREDRPERGSYVPGQQRRSNRPPESAPPGPVMQRDYQRTDRSARSDRTSARTNGEYLMHQTTNQFGNRTNVGGNNNEAPTHNHGNNAYNHYDLDPRRHSGERSSSGTVQQRRSSQPPASAVSQRDHQTDSIVRSSRTRSTDEYSARYSRQAIEGVPVHAPQILTPSAPSYVPSSYSDPNSRRVEVARTRRT
ncbi:hypothetical protein L218DRAFT_296600 [Marasmius fiardii PR-910]|nr:hypothetical protein L218DRAFT_296600 [Marasmius fiardii PR-910]